jgi:hypothetical protein
MDIAQQEFGQPIHAIPTRKGLDVSGFGLWSGATVRGGENAIGIDLRIAAASVALDCVR